jgi:hypothetical protein
VPADTSREHADVTTLDDDDLEADEDLVVDRDAGEDAELFDQDRIDGEPQVDEDEEEAELEPTGEHADLVPPAIPPAKPSRREHRAEMKRSARRIRRVVRHIDAWSVFKVASIFVACVWGVIVLASLLIWRAAESSGSVENTEEFVKDIGFKDFDFDPEQMFNALLSAGAVMAVASIFFIVLLTVLFNLICDMTGGVRVTMIEQDLAEARKRPRGEDA